MVSLIKNKGTYNQQTRTYTSPTGAKYSMNLDNAKKVGAVIVNPLLSKTKKSSSSSTSTTQRTTSTPLMPGVSSSSTKQSLFTPSMKALIEKQQQSKRNLLYRPTSTYRYSKTSTPLMPGVSSSSTKQSLFTPSMKALIEKQQQSKRNLLNNQKSTVNLQKENKYFSLFIGNNKILTVLNKLKNTTKNETTKKNLTNTINKIYGYISNREAQYGSGFPEENILGNDYKIVQGYLNDLYTKEPNLKDKIKTFAINPYAVKTLSGFALGIVENIEDFIYLPRTLVAIPKILKDKTIRNQVYSTTSQSFSSAKSKLLRGDLSSLAYIVGAIGIPDITDLVTDIGVKYIKKGTSRLAKLSRNYLGDLDVGDKIIIQSGNRKITKALNDIDIKKIKIDNALNVIDNKLINAIKSNNKFKISNLLQEYNKLNKIKLKISESIPRRSLSSQTSLAGKEVIAISSQANQLLTAIKKRVLIRKPIPKEASFNSITKNLLKKFDAGSITTKEMIQLDMLIKKQGSKGLLETSFFADPSGIIRPSRLGKNTNQKIATFKDLITGDFTFKKQKPQILLFTNAEIEKFPSSLKDIELKLKRNVPLTELEQARLLRWQLTNSGKFKPIGFLTRENEITIPAGSLIKRNKVVGKVTSKGRVINLVETEIYNPSTKIKKALNDLQSGKLTKQQTDTLNKILYKETNINYGLSSSKLPLTKPYLSINRVFYKTGSILRKLLPNVNKYSFNNNYVKTGGKSSLSRTNIKSPRKIVTKYPTYNRGNIVKGSSKYYPPKSPVSPTKKSPKKTPVIILSNRYPMVIGMYEKLNKGFISNIQIGKNKYKSLNRIPLSFSRILNISTYSLLKNKSKLAIISVEQKKFPISTIKRKVPVANNYFIRNKAKVKLYYDNNKKIFYLIKK